MIRRLFGVVFGCLSLFALASPTSLVHAQECMGFGCDAYVKDVGVPKADEGLQGDKLLTTIKNFINWMLGLMATIAFALCMYGGFLMVTAAGDDGKQKKGMTILKQAAIGLIIIGLSWLIISFVFWLIGTMISK